MTKTKFFHDKRKTNPLKYFPKTQWKEREYKKEKYNYSLIEKFRKEGKSTEEFECMLNQFSLEEIIGLKLELASRVIGGNLFGLPLFHSLTNICKDAVIKYAFSAAKTGKEAASFLSLIPLQFKYFRHKYDVDHYFLYDDEDFCHNEKD